MVGKDVQVVIDDFAELQGIALAGTVIRSSNDNGNYIVGCRMPDDNEAIRNYVAGIL